MKRYIAALLIAVLLVPLLAVPVFAETLVMGEVIPDEYFPDGFVIGTMPRIGGRDSEFVFYDSAHDMFIHIAFNGSVRFGLLYHQYAMSFSDYPSLLVRAYECKGRDVLALTPDQMFDISVPAQTITSKFQGTAYQDFFGQLEQRTSNRTGPMSYRFYYNSNGTLNYIQSSETSGMVSDYIYANSFGSEISLPDLRTTIGAMNIPITIKEHSTQYFDYYVVQEGNSSVTTAIDYPLKYSAVSSPSGGVLSLGGQALLGVPVAVTFSNWSTVGGPIFFDGGSYYFGNSTVGRIELHNSELIPIDHYTRLRLSFLNRYLTHFGYESIYYSEQNAQLSSDIDAVGGTIGDWSSAAGDYNSMASSSIASVQSSVLAFTPIFTAVWNILPSWFMSMLAVVFVIVIGRKILGR